MADLNDNPDIEAKKWFTIVIVGALLYVSTVFAFVVGRDAGPSAAPQEPQNGQSN